MSKGSQPKIDYHLHYQRLHQFSDEYYRMMKRFYLRVLKAFLPADKSARILDFGCGTGFLLNALIENGYSNAFGVDSDAGQVEIARQRHLPVEQIEAEQTMEFLASLEGRLDLVFMIDVLEHIQKDLQIEMLGMVRSTLTPQGSLVCQVPNALWMLGTYVRYTDWTHEMLFTVDSLAFLLENAGMSIISIGAGHDRPSPPRNALASIAVPPLRWILQGATGSIWKVFVVSSLGLGSGLSHPISANLIAVAGRKSP